MKPIPLPRIPALIACGVLVAIILVRLADPDLLQRVENLTFDMRVRQALRIHAPAATNLGFVYIDDETIRAVQNGDLGYRFGLYWPRQVYGRLVQELAAQGAQVIAFDVLFGEPRPDHPPVQMADGRLVESDDFFALQIRKAGNVVLAATPDLSPPSLFATNAAALGDISTAKDKDGVLRRVQAFHVRREWHPAFQQAAREFGFNLDFALVQTNAIVLRRAGEDDIHVPLNGNGDFELADFVGDKLPPGLPPRAKPFREVRRWHMGLVLGAMELGLNLDQAEVDLERGRIRLRSAEGVERVIPVDRQGAFYIDWSLPPDAPALKLESALSLLRTHSQRLEVTTTNGNAGWTGKLAVVGSSAIGNDLSDRGATPLRSDTLLASKHWNVASSIITGRFVQRASLPVEIAVILLLGTFSALITWRMRAISAFVVVLLSSLAYVVVACALYWQSRFWLPLVLPVLGGLLMNHLCLLTWRVVFEQSERRRVRSVFSKVVSRKIVDELLQAGNLDLGGTRREITVFFADVRGFTEFTDNCHERVTRLIEAKGLQGDAAEGLIDSQARETLATVNLYLGLIADIVIRHDGTLDKFIGDCVMAFWGAPASNPAHAVSCVRAAIEAQRAIYRLNEERARLNADREKRNQERALAGLEAEPLLPLLQLGSGINTGMATVGLMGSAAETRSYTVFGRDVNLASRLESVSGRGRIIISEATHRHLVRDDPALAAACVPLEPVTVKGIRTPVPIFEVPWK